MASKNSPTITLNLDFNVEKAKIQEISTLLDKNLSKGLKSGKGDSYFNNISTAVNQATREATQLYKALSKPLGSKNEAVKLGKSLETVFDGLEDKILSFQGNVSKTLNSIGNTEALRQIKALGNEISAMMDDYQQINKLNAIEGFPELPVEYIDGLLKETELWTKYNGLIWERSTNWRDYLIE